MQAVAVGYEVFKRTQWPLALGLVGLVQIVPVLALALIAGHVADRFNRRNIILVSLACTVLASLGLAVVSLRGSEIWVLYFLVMITGVVRGFSQPCCALHFCRRLSRAIDFRMPSPGAPAPFNWPLCWGRRWEAL